MLSSPFLIGRRAISVSGVLLKGHSKWQNIKETKGKNDSLRSKTISILLNKVRRAVIRGGFDPKLNRELADLEQEYKSKSLPLDSFRNFIVKLKEKPEFPVTFHVVGPSGTFFIVEGITGSKKALEQTMRKYFNKVGGFRFASRDSAVQSWFEEKGIVIVKALSTEGPISIEKMEDIGIELDCEDVTLIEDEERTFELVCDAKKLSKVENALVDRGLSVESTEIEFRPTHPISVKGDDASKIEKFYELLQEDDSIRQIYDNIEPGT